MFIFSSRYVWLIFVIESKIDNPFVDNILNFSCFERNENWVNEQDKPSFILMKWHFEVRTSAKAGERMIS